MERGLKRKSLNILNKSGLAYSVYGVIDKTKMQVGFNINRLIRTEHVIVLIRSLGHFITNIAPNAPPAKENARYGIRINGRKSVRL